MRYAVIIIIFLLSGCRLLDEGGADSPSGTYSYVAFDDDGEAAVTGELYIDAKPGDEPRSFLLEGTWKTRSAGPIKPGLGPQVGEGKLVGSVDRDGTFRINLNPDYADNNVNLTGVFENRRYDDVEGEWEHVTFVGPTSEGTFAAARDSGVDG